MRVLQCVFRSFIWGKSSIISQHHSEGFFDHVACQSRQNPFTANKPSWIWSLSEIHFYNENIFLVTILTLTHIHRRTLYFCCINHSLAAPSSGSKFLWPQNVHNFHKLKTKEEGTNLWHYLLLKWRPADTFPPQVKGSTRKEK